MPKQSDCDNPECAPFCKGCGPDGAYDFTVNISMGVITIGLLIILAVLVAEYYHP